MKESEWSLGMQLSRSYYAFKRAAAKRMEAFGLTPEQFSVLSELAKQDGVSQKQLALVTERDQTTIGKILDKLGKKELIVRTPDPLGPTSGSALDDTRRTRHRRSPRARARSATTRSVPWTIARANRAIKSNT